MGYNDNKKSMILVIAIFVGALIVGAVASYFIWFNEPEKSKEETKEGLQYAEPESEDAPIYHSRKQKDIFNQDKLEGLWHEGDVFYRYELENNTALTWDESDDVTEEEADELDWSLEGEIFTHKIHIKMGGVLPKMYTMKVLEDDYMEYDDDFGGKHKLDKVEELKPLS